MCSCDNNPCNCGSPFGTCKTNLPETCEPFQETVVAQKILVEDEQGCKRTLQPITNNGLPVQKDDTIILADGSVENPINLEALKFQKGQTIPKIIGQTASGDLIAILGADGAAEPQMAVWSGSYWALLNRSEMFGTGSGLLARALASPKFASWITGTTGQIPTIQSSGEVLFQDPSPLTAAYLASLVQKIPPLSNDRFLILDTDGNSVKTTPFSELQTSGSIIQSSYTENNSLVSSSAIIPLDDTIPQIGEGTQLLTLTITPKSVTSKIRIRFSATIGRLASTDPMCIVSLFNGATNAIYAMSGNVYGTLNVFAGGYQDSPATTSPITYTVRFGPTSAVTVYANGAAGARYLGGSSKASMVIEEIKA